MLSGIDDACVEQQRETLIRQATDYLPCW